MQSSLRENLGVVVFSSHEKHTMMHECSPRCGSEVGKRQVASCHRGWGSNRVHVRALLKHMSWIDTFKISSLYVEFKKKKTPTKRAENEPAQVSPFWTRATGGCMKSLKGPRASFRAELTSDEEHVMHSTSVGYRPITWAHVLSSTAGGTQRNKRGGRQYKLWNEAIREVLFSHLIEIPHVHGNNLGYPNILKEMNLRAWFPYIPAIMNIIMGRPCWGKKKLSSVWKSQLFRKKPTPNYALTCFNGMSSWKTGIVPLSFMSSLSVFFLSDLFLQFRTHHFLVVSF